MSLGVLHVRIFQARHLRNVVSWGQKMDPFVEVSVGSIKKTTAICCKGHKAPTWKEESLTLILDDTNAALPLTLEVLSNERFHAPLHIGSCTIALSACFHQLSIPQQWYTLETSKKKFAGEIQVQLTYEPWNDQEVEIHFAPSKVTQDPIKPNPAAITATASLLSTSIPPKSNYALSSSSFSSTLPTANSTLPSRIHPTYLTPPNPVPTSLYPPSTATSIPPNSTPSHPTHPLYPPPPPPTPPRRHSTPILSSSSTTNLFPTSTTMTATPSLPSLPSTSSNPSLYSSSSSSTSTSSLHLASYPPGLHPSSSSLLSPPPSAPPFPLPSTTTTTTTMPPSSFPTPSFYPTLPPLPPPTPRPSQPITDSTHPSSLFMAPTPHSSLPYPTTSAPIQPPYPSTNSNFYSTSESTKKSEPSFYPYPYPNPNPNPNLYPYPNSHSYSNSNLNVYPYPSPYPPYPPHPPPSSNTTTATAFPSFSSSSSSYPMPRP